MKKKWGENRPKNEEKMVRKQTKWNGMKLMKWHEMKW